MKFDTYSLLNTVSDELDSWNVRKQVIMKNQLTNSLESRLVRHTPKASNRERG